MVMLDDMYGVYYSLNVENGVLMVTGYGYAFAGLGDEILGTYEYIGNNVIVITDEDGNEYKFLCGYYGGIGVFYVYDEDSFGVGTYVTDKYESLTLDGYGSATFVDVYGISYEGSIERDGDNYRFTSYAYGELELDIVVTLGTDGAFTWAPYTAA